MLKPTTCLRQATSTGSIKVPGPLLALLLLLVVAHPAWSEVPWGEIELTGGPRMMAADTGSEDNVAISFYFRGGTARTDGDYELARLAPWVFLDGGGDSGERFTDRLQDLGWLYRVRVDLDGGGVFLAGPAAGVPQVMEHLQERLRDLVPVDQGALDRGWLEVESGWERAAEREEVILRGMVDQLYYGSHPYGVGGGDLPPADPLKPTTKQLGSFLASYYRPIDLVVFAAGALDPNEFLARWSRGFDVSLNRTPLSMEYPLLEPGKGRITLPGSKSRSTLIVRFPGPTGLENDGIATALLAGVMSRYLQSEIVDVGLASNCAAWFDFMAPGPKPIEVQVRNFHPGDTERIEDLLLSICRKIREGDFSRFQVISAKDFILQGLDSSGKHGDGPVRNSAGALIGWSQTVAWRNLYFQGWADEFTEALLGTGKERIQLEARKRLVPDDAVWGLLSAAAGLD